MEQENAKHPQSKRRFVRQSRVYVPVALPLLILSFVSAGATKTETGPISATREPASSYCSSTNLTIKLRGLLFFSFRESRRPGERSECQVGILSTRQDHNLYVQIDGGQAYVIPHAALQTMSPEIVIDTDKTRTSGATLKNSATSNTWGAPRNRYDRSDTYHDLYDFNWILDFEGVELHDGNIDIRPNRLRPTLRFRVGEFFTETVSRYPFYIVQNGRARPFGYVAEITGVCISLMPGEHLQITGIFDTPITVPETTREIKLYNVTEEDWQDVRRLAADARIENKPGLASPQQKESAVNHFSRMAMPANHPDAVQIYYDELLELAGRPRVFFIPVVRPEQSDPFVCYGGGGSVRP